MTPNQLIFEYLEAFRDKNTMNEPPNILYEGGWFTFKSLGTAPRKYRGREVEDMRDRLRQMP